MSEHLSMQERIDALEEAKQEILDALEKAREAVKGTSEEGRAKAYWYAHIRTALDREHSYLGSSMCTLQDAIDDLKEQREEIGYEEFKKEKAGRTFSESEEAKGDVFNPPAIEGVEVRQLRTDEADKNREGEEK